MTFKKISGGTFQNEQGVVIEDVHGYGVNRLRYSFGGHSFTADLESGWENPTDGTAQYDPSAGLPGTHFVSLEVGSPLTPEPGLIPFSDEQIAKQLKEALLLAAPTSKVKVTLNGVEI